MLKINGLWFGYDSHPLISDLNLQVDQGQKVAITGPSGSGKTTLFQLICGTCRPSRGFIDLQSPFSYMSQKDSLLPWKTLYQNFEFAKHLCCSIKLSHGFLSLYDELLSLVDLEGKGDLYPYQLSGGMRQRASLAQTLLFDKPFLLLDEPFSSIDMKTKKRILFNLLAFVEKKKKTLLIITHDIGEISLLEAKHYALDEGKLVFVPGSV